MSLSYSLSLLGEGWGEGVARQEEEKRRFVVLRL